MINHKFKIDISALSYESICRFALIAACSIMVIIAPLYWLFADAPEFFGLEKRYRVKWPEITTDAFLSGRWGERVDSWMADKMPAREFFVGVDSYVWYLSGRQSARDVYVSKEGNLVEAPADYAPAELYKRLDKFINFTKQANDIAAQLQTQKASPQPDMHDADAEPAPAPAPVPAPAPEVKSVLLTPLDAGYIATLPPRLANGYRDDEISEAIQSYLESTDMDGAGIAYTDIRAQMLGAEEALYYRTDHHWNGDGVYLAYSYLGGSLGYQPLPKNAFTVETANKFYGSTYAKSGLWLTQPDAIEMWSPPCRVRVTVMDATKDPEERESLFFSEFLEDWDMYSVFLGGIHGVTVIENLDAENDTESNVQPGAQPGAKTLFVIKDSYANSLLPLLIAHYDRIVAIDLRNYRGEAGSLLREYAIADADSVAADISILYIYSMNHIVNDPDILWLR